MVYLLIAVIAFGIGILITYLCLFRKLRRTSEINHAIEEQNRELDEKNKQLYETGVQLNAEIDYLDQTKAQLQQQNTEALHSLKELYAQVATAEEQSAAAGQAIYEKNMEIARLRFQEDLKKEQEKYDEAVAAYLKEFFQVMQDSVTEFKEETSAQVLHCEELRRQEIELQSTVEAAVAAAKRAEALKTQADFYKIQLSEADLEEIRMLRNIAPYLRDQEPLNKVIWKVYYEKPTTDLIGRVIGAGVHTGIYKITNLDNNKCYVGQAANLADRWKQHIKRGIGAETPTRNKLYPAMLAIGVERFSFEVIEECSRDHLDAREDYWQDYFKAKEFGYSIK